MTAMAEILAAASLLRRSLGLTIGAALVRSSSCILSYKRVLKIEKVIIGFVSLIGRVSEVVTLGGYRLEAAKDGWRGRSRLDRWRS